MAGNNDANSSGTILLTLLCHKIIIAKTSCSYNWTLPLREKKEHYQETKAFLKSGSHVSKETVYSFVILRERKQNAMLLFRWLGACPVFQFECVYVSRGFFNYLRFPRSRFLFDL